MCVSYSKKFKLQNNLRNLVILNILTMFEKIVTITINKKHYVKFLLSLLIKWTFFYTDHYWKLLKIQKMFNCYK